MSVANTLYNGLKSTGLSGVDDWDSDGVSYRARERKVIAFLGAVAVHRCQQNLSGPQRRNFLGIGNGLEAGRIPTAVRKDFPPIPFARLRYFLGIDRHNNALVAEFLRGFFDKRAPVDRRGIDRHFVR